MCEIITSGGKVFVYLDHQAIINKAYMTSGSPNYKLRSELFDFKAKDKDTTHNEPKRKRKKNHPQTLHEKFITATDTDILQAWASIETKLHNLVKKNVNLTQMPRVWEEVQSDNFPKFKGSNNTASFQIIETLVKGKSFLIPPKTTFYNYNIVDLENYVSELSTYDLIVLDPPWRNKYIRRLKKHNLGYNMLENKHLQDLPIRWLIHTKSVVSIWCTNAKQHQEALVNDFLPAWNLRLLHKIRWLKLNTLGQLISVPTINLEQKQPYEQLFIACHQDATIDFGLQVKEVDFILSVPSVVHSHKPPLLDWLQSYFNSFTEDPKCLELFARYLQPNFTSFGVEVLKLMDYRLYQEIYS